MKRKILFVIPEYSHGGTNKSLENLLALIDHSMYDISIYCMYEDGGDYYRRLFAPYILRKSRLYYWLHDNASTRKVMGLYNKLTKRDNFGWLYKRETRLLQDKYRFDTVIGYQEGLAAQFVANFNNCKKIAWIQCDLGAYATYDWLNHNRCYLAMDAVVSVSEVAVNSFKALCPDMADKTHAVYNLLNVEDIRSKANAEKAGELNDACFNIVSVGRLNRVKQFGKISYIASAVNAKVSKPFCWYIIGEGEEEGKIREEIAKYGIAENVRLLGAMDNPYPYIQQADMVACLSLSESFSYVIAEAKILHTPVLTSDFPVAYEVVDEKTGWIANVKEMSEVLVNIISDNDGIYKKKITLVSDYEYSNEPMLEKIRKIL